MSATNLSANLLAGLAYTFPIEGVIRMGFVVERNGKRLPQKDDQFSITMKYKSGNSWMPHPLDSKLRAEYGEDVGDDEGAGAKKLRKIPVVIAFDNPDLTITEQYAAFTREGRQLCVGNGKNARRRDEAAGAVEDVACNPATCSFGYENRCEPFMRTLVQIEGQGHEGSCFIVRTGSHNAVVDVRTTLESCKALFGGLAGLPMWLTLEAKSSSQSRQSTFWYASLRPRLSSHRESARAIKDFRQAEVEAGLNREAYETTLMELRNNGGMGGFNESPDDDAQMEDLVIARFTERSSEGARTIAVGARPSAVAELELLAGRLKPAATQIVVPQAASAPGDQRQDAQAPGGAPAVISAPSAGDGAGIALDPAA